MIRAELKNKVNTKKFVNAFFDNISTAIKSSWVPRIEVAFDQHKD